VQVIQGKANSEENRFYGLIITVDIDDEYQNEADSTTLISNCLIRIPETRLYMSLV
jgi:hypothetical protein